MRLQTAAATLGAAITVSLIGLLASHRNLQRRPPAPRSGRSTTITPFPHRISAGRSQQPADPQAVTLRQGIARKAVLLSVSGVGDVEEAEGGSDTAAQAHPGGALFTATAGGVLQPHGGEANRALFRRVSATAASSSGGHPAEGRGSAAPLREVDALLLVGFQQRHASCRGIGGGGGGGGSEEEQEEGGAGSEPPPSDNLSRLLCGAPGSVARLAGWGAGGGGGGGGGSGVFPFATPPFLKASYPASFQAQLEGTVLPLAGLCRANGFETCAVAVLGGGGGGGAEGLLGVPPATSLLPFFFPGGGGGGVAARHILIPSGAGPAAAAPAAPPAAWLQQSRRLLEYQRNRVLSQGSPLQPGSTGRTSHSSSSGEAAVDSEASDSEEGRDEAGGAKGGPATKRTLLFLRNIVGVAEGEEEEEEEGRHQRYFAEQEWVPQLVRKFAEGEPSVRVVLMDLAVPLRPAGKRVKRRGGGGAADLSAVVEAVRSADGVIALYSDLAFLSVFLRDGAAVVLLSPPGVGHAQHDALERVIRVNPSLRIVNHRGLEDSEQRTSSTAFRQAARFKITKREVEELHAEVLLAMTGYTAVPLADGEGQGPRPLPGSLPSRGGSRGGAHTAVRWLLPRTKYDPDHFEFGPVLLQRDGTIRIYNTTGLFEGVPHGGQGGLLGMTGSAGLPGAVPGFGRYTENDAHYYPHPVVSERGPLRLSGGGSPCGAVVPGSVAVFFHYPWVRDNIYHSHNDNFWPLFLSDLEQRRGGSKGGGRASRALILLKTKRTNAPVPAYAEICSKLFSPSGSVEDFFRDIPGAHVEGEVDTVCIERAVWGRPRRQFSAHWRDVAVYAQRQVVQRWRAEVYGWYQIPLSVRSEEIRVVWLDRSKGQRVLANSGSLLSTISALNGGVAAEKCCSGLSFQQQVDLMQGTQILFGVHGAGLLHIVFLREESVAVHLAPPRLPHHEQVIIERMALMANVGYLNTHLHTPPSQQGTWHIPSFSIPVRDFHAVASQAFRMLDARRGGS